MQSCGHILVLYNLAGIELVYQISCVLNQATKSTLNEEFCDVLSLFTFKFQSCESFVFKGVTW